ncbi:MAG: substrate-binding domain-containing protein [Gammaproteobacteria bacterium]|nr:substrate-binding domain-containing protein [Gammaproteobacteria bacterium]
MLRILVLLLVFVHGVSLPSAAAERVRLATTTSTQDSGLLDRLVPAFTQSTGITVDVIAVGSGKALALARNGDVDVVLVHDPEAEAAFVAAGDGIERAPVMRNDFVFVGPAADPAHLREAASAADALARVARTRSPFVSRGDQSGTHMKELALFAAAGIAPRGDWYLAAGQGMGPVLQIAAEKQAYTLADRGTWLARRRALSLVLLYEGDALLSNPYHVIVVNPARHPHVQVSAARAWAGFLTGARGQRLIDGYTVDGERLFVPETAR